MQIQRVKMNSMNNNSYSNKKNPAFGVNIKELEKLATDRSFNEIFLNMPELANAFKQFQSKLNDIGLDRFVYRLDKSTFLPENVKNLKVEGISLYNDNTKPITFDYIDAYMNINALLERKFLPTELRRQLLSRTPSDAEITAAKKADYEMSLTIKRPVFLGDEHKLSTKTRGYGDNFTMRQYLAFLNDIRGLENPNEIVLLKK